MEVLAVRRTDAVAVEDGVTVFGQGDIAGLWHRAEVVLVCAPLTPETAGLLGREAIAALPDNAIVVNIGRGGIIDEEALFNELKSGRLHGAGLDVWWNYPAPGENCRPSQFAYEDLDNVVMSPHNGGTVDDTEPARMDALATLVTSLSEGTCTQRPVDPILGY